MKFVIVLGNFDQNIRISRVKRAVEYVNSLPIRMVLHNEEFSHYHNAQVKVIFSGGGRDAHLNGSSGAEEMADIAVNQFGLSKDLILLEKTSSNTHENLENSLKLLENLHYFKYFEHHTFVICTSTFHIKRAYITALHLLRDHGQIKCIHTNEITTLEQAVHEKNLLDQYIEKIMFPLCLAT